MRQAECTGITGIAFPQENDFALRRTQEAFASNLKPLIASPELRAARRQLGSPGNGRLHRCKLGDLCRLATVDRPDICARSARIASRANSFQGSDIYCISDLVETVHVWRKAAVLRFASSPRLRVQARGDIDGRARVSGGRIHCGSMFAGRSDVANGDGAAEAQCRLGFVIGPTSSTLGGPCHMLRRTSKFAGLADQVYAFSEIADHMSLPREFRSPSDLSSGIGLEDCGRLYNRPKNKRATTERRFDSR